MNREYISFCPKCNAFFKVDARNKSNTCPDCKGQLVKTGVKYAQYERMSEKAQIAFERQYTQNPDGKDGKNTESKDSDVWMSVLEAACAIVTAILFLFSLFMLGRNVGLGIVVMIAMGSIALVLISVVMVFVGMARDLRAIRNMLEEKKNV